jgi:hypothetical protein
MDTRFWGPSGWRLLHLITFTYEASIQKNDVKELFEMLPFVLPCKFCRASLSEYMEKELLEPALQTRAKLTRWLYKIHNHVNEKLRSQGLLKETNPTFTSVKKVYEERVAAGCVRTEFEGWDFLFSIAENHPLSYSAKNSNPMPDAPTEKVLTPEERNRWNLMPPEERIHFYKRFWASLDGALPFDSWRTAWRKCGLSQRALDTRKSTIQALWKIRCCMEKELELVNHEEYQHLCKRLAEHRSGCGKKARARTCRRITRKRAID